MSDKISHKDLEMCIGGKRDCDDYLQLKIAGYYPAYGKVAVAARRGVDKFFFIFRGPKSDLSEAIPLDSRYLVIGDLEDIDTRIFNACALQGKADVWLEVPDDLYISRLLIAGAIRIITINNQLPPPLAQTAEYKQALRDRRVIEIVC